MDNRMPEGVFPARRKDGTAYYRASLTCQGKHISLGSHPTPEDAHAAYLEGKRLLHDPALTPEHCTLAHSLSFDKWICLINYRDNHIYFSTPIYVGRKMFYYYLSPAEALKFDLDDLFFYSSHKIMRRGNHYFVADYGSQLSIVSRYGIRPYARPGTDYRFLNGDPLDFRRENLEILNSYHGVTAEKKNGQYLYTVRIHIHGNYLVGRYPDELTAAIAYNRAVDILKKNGVRKNFPTNYIEDLSPRRYAEIYSSVRISEKICGYRPTSPNNQQS